MSDEALPPSPPGGSPAPPAPSTPAPPAPLPAVRRYALAVLVRPRLWPAALAEVARLARPGWWRHWPPVPAPTPELWRFRMITAYGGRGDAEPDVGDVLAFLRWAGRMGRWRKA
jgi:hypothetical protein